MALLKDCHDDAKLTEGLRLTAYKDGEGILSIGYGRNLEGEGITEDEAEFLLSNDLDRILLWAENNIVWYNSLGAYRQRAIINMIYNLGTAGFDEFVKFKICMSVGDFAGAAHELLSSLAAMQDPNRYQWLAKMILTDEQAEYGR